MEDRSKQVALLFRKLFRGTDSRATGEPDQLPDEEIERRVKAVLQRVSEEVRELWGAVPDQDRSGFEYRLACEAVKAGVTNEMDLACLIFTSVAHQDKFSGRKDSWKRAVACARKALTAGEEGKAGKKPTQANVLVQLAQQAELFHTPDGIPYATVPVGDHRETWPIRSRRFSQWLKRMYYAETNKVPSSAAMSDALGVLEARALWDGQEKPVHIRVAGYEGRIYLDLCNPRWEVVEITREGWRVIQDPPVKFTRTEGMLELPRPLGGNVRHLRPFTNVADEDSWRLLCSWLVMALRPTGPYPVLILQGEQGSSKSTLARVLRSLIDPSSAPLRSAPKEERDLLIAARNSWVISLDNLSGTPPWLSDALCRLATGGGFSTRALYTDAEEVIFSAQRPIMLNGIDDVATREDLRDRAIVLQLPHIPSNERKPEQVFWREFEGVRPAILGGLLDAVATAMRREDEVVLPELPRMADFARWGAAAAPALGWKEENFMSSYQRNLQHAIEVTLDSNLVASAVRDLVGATEGKRWEGTASELLLSLLPFVDDELRRGRAWPKAPHVLSNQLKRVAPILRAVGIEVRLGGRVGRHGRRVIEIKRIGKEAAAASVVSVKTP